MLKNKNVKLCSSVKENDKGIGTLQVYLKCFLRAYHFGAVNDLPYLFIQLMHILHSICEGCTTALFGVINIWGMFFLSNLTHLDEKGFYVLSYFNFTMKHFKEYKRTKGII